MKEALSRNELASVGQTHTGVDRRQPKPMRTPLAVLVQTNNVPRLRHLAMSVSSGKTKQSRRPPNVDKGKRRATLAEGNEFWRRGRERKESQSGLRCRMNLASEFLSIGDVPPTAIGPCYRETTAPAEEDP